MGHDISQATHEALETNRRNGVLCCGSSRYCATPSTYGITILSYRSEIGVGEAREHTLTMCTKHSRDYRTGNVAPRNFVIMAINPVKPFVSVLEGV